MVTLHTVPKDIADRVEKWVTSSKIPWFHFSGTLGQYEYRKVDVDQDKYIIQDLPRFSHYFYPNSKTPQEDRLNIMPLTEWVITQLLPGYEVRRVMGNLTTQVNSNNLLNLPHPDADNPNVFTFLYYVNDCDGKTVFFNSNKNIEHEFDPVKGTGVLFKSNIVHAGQCPSINTTRYVINIIFGKKKSGDKNEKPSNKHSVNTG